MARVFSRNLTMVALLFFVSAGLLLIGAPPASAQAFEPDDETCLGCHEGFNGGLNGTKHRLTTGNQKATVKIGCVSCHSGAEVHIDDPMLGNIGNPSKQTTDLVQATCTECHNPHTQMGTAGFDPHIGQGLNCTSCHSVHKGHQGLLVDENADFCASCHGGVVNQFRQRSNHPLADGNVTCLSCHDFTGSMEPMVGHGSMVNCADCHAEQVGPFLHEHKAASSFSTEGDGCMSCHNPHGSPNDRLLNQPNDAMCMQCHGTPPTHLTAHNGIAVGRGCIDCHSQVHGSFENRNLLDNNLGSKIGGQPESCFCHGATE